jgi:hypothetical protein
MWKLKFWLVVARIYNRLSDVMLDISSFFHERCKHGVKKYDEYSSKYAESKESNHEYLK